MEKTRLPLYIEQDENGLYAVECPLLQGCYTQGETLDEALKNIREVVHLLMEEKENKDIIESYHPKEISLHTISI